MRKRVLLSFPILVILLITSIGTVYASQNPTVTRLAGYDRYETAYQIAKTGWQQSDNVLLAYGENYPDALAAVPLAKKLNAPILLTDKDSLNAKTSTALQELKVKTVYVVGGTAVISTNVENQLTNAGYLVKRIVGQDRYDTAIELAKELGDINEVAITTGDDYADALSIASIAAEKQMPILLVPKDDITPSIQSYINSKTITKAYVVGGQEIISDKVVNKFSNPERIIGQDKYDRNIAVLNNFKDVYHLEKICLATGDNFADALAGAVYAAKNSGAVVLVKSDLPVSTKEFLMRNIASLTNITVFGGEGVISRFLLQTLFENKLDFGTVYGQTYTNEYFGLTINIPDQLQVDDNIALTKTALGNKNIADSSDASKDYDVVLLSLTKKSQTGLNKFQFISEALKVNSMNANEYLIYVKKVLADLPLKYVFPKDIYTEKIGDIDFSVLETQLKINDFDTMYFKIYASVQNGYTLLFKEIYVNNDSLSDLNQILSSIQFSADVKNREAYFRKGELLYNANKYEEALDCFVEAAKISSNYVSIISHNAYKLRINSNFQTSLLYYEKVIEIRKDWTGYLQKGLCLKDLKRFEEALEYYNYADKLKPNELSILHNKSDVLKILGRTEEAEKCLNEAVKIEPKSAFDYNNKGNVLIDLKRYEEAIVCFDKSIELDPNDPNDYNNKGIALYKLGRYDEAIANYDKAIKMYPNYAYAYQNKSSALLKLGQNDEAAECMKKYNKLMGNN